MGEELDNGIGFCGTNRVEGGEKEIINETVGKR